MATKKSGTRGTTKQTGSKTSSQVLTHGLRNGLQTEHKVVHEAQVLDHDIRMAQVLSSGNPKRIEKYFLRRLAYKIFAKLMGKTLNRL